MLDASVAVGLEAIDLYWPRYRTLNPAMRRSTYLTKCNNLNSSTEQISHLHILGGAAEGANLQEGGNKRK